MTRSSAFFNSDVASKAETLAYALGEDYGLTEDETSALAEAVEKAVYDYFEER